MTVQTPTTPADGPPRPSRPALLMATVDTLPKPFAVVGMVEAAIGMSVHQVPTIQLFDELERQAVRMGANAVIGIRLHQLLLPGSFRTRPAHRVADHEGGSVLAIALGTAVRLDGRTPGLPRRRR